MQRLVMLLGIAIGTLAGPALLTGGAGLATIALGLALIVYALWGLGRCGYGCGPRRACSRPRRRGDGGCDRRDGRIRSPSVPYLQALDLDKDDLVQAMGLSFTVSTLALAATLVRDNAFQPALAAASLAALLPALGGMAGGQWIRARVEPSTFRICFFLGLLALGGHLASNAVL